MAKEGNIWLRKLTLSAFSVILAVFILSNSAYNLESCSAVLVPYTRISSAWQSTPGRPARMSFIWYWPWSTSGVLLMPNGSLLKQNRPYGVIKVVNSLDSAASGICPNPLLASSLLKIIAPVSFARAVLTLGIGCTCTSHNTCSLRGFMSTQIQTAPEAFGTTTIAAHHAVGSVADDITPKLPMHCKVCLKKRVLNWEYFINMQMYPDH